MLEAKAEALAYLEASARATQQQNRQQEQATAKANTGILPLRCAQGQNDKRL
jgi:hypothetical protein